MIALLVIETHAFRSPSSCSELSTTSSSISGIAKQRPPLATIALRMDSAKSTISLRVDFSKSSSNILERTCLHFSCPGLSAIVILAGVLGEDWVEIRFVFGCMDLIVVMIAIALVFAPLLLCASLAISALLEHPSVSDTRQPYLVYYGTCCHRGVSWY